MQISHDPGLHHPDPGPQEKSTKVAFLLRLSVLVWYRITHFMLAVVSSGALCGPMGLIAHYRR